MTLVKNQKELLRDNDVWIISSGKPVKLDLSKICAGIQLTPVMEYRISDLARYLLNPSPIEVKKILVGCEVHYHQPFFDKVRENVRQILPQRMQGLLKERRNSCETLTVKKEKYVCPLKDKDFESHIDKIRSALRVYDPVLRRLSKLERDEICTIKGICEDIGGNRSLLNLKGDIDDKISYVASYILKDVGVVLEKAHVSDGLFEMTGFDFSSYDARKAHRLIKFYADGKPKFCVIGFHGKVEYWVDNINLINQMHLLQHSLKANPKFNNSLSLCSRGDAKPLRLLFKKELEIDYTKSPLPALYKTLFDNYKLGSNEKNAVMKSLQNSLFGILFNYVPFTGTGEKKLLTNVSVMHDVRALESLREDLPELYSMINKMVSVSEAGKYYLLDSIRGYGNE